MDSGYSVWMLETLEPEQFMEQNPGYRIDCSHIHGSRHTQPSFSSHDPDSHGMARISSRKSNRSLTVDSGPMTWVSYNRFTLHLYSSYLDLIDVYSRIFLTLSRLQRHSVITNAKCVHMYRVNASTFFYGIISKAWSSCRRGMHAGHSSLATQTHRRNLT